MKNKFLIALLYISLFVLGGCDKSEEESLKKENEELRSEITRLNDILKHEENKKTEETDLKGKNTALLIDNSKLKSQLEAEIKKNKANKDKLEAEYEIAFKDQLVTEIKRDNLVILFIYLIAGSAAIFLLHKYLDNSIKHDRGAIKKQKEELDRRERALQDELNITKEEMIKEKNTFIEEKNKEIDAEIKRNKDRETEIKAKSTLSKKLDALHSTLSNYENILANNKV